MNQKKLAFLRSTTLPITQLEELPEKDQNERVDKEIAPKRSSKKRLTLPTEYERNTENLCITYLQLGMSYKNLGFYRDSIENFVPS